MEDYIRGNKDAWEEAWENRSKDWGTEVEHFVCNEHLGYFNEETKKVLEKYNLQGKNVAQFCCNNGRELLSLCRSTGAKEGIGFDIAENQIAFANAQAEKLKVPCHFVAVNILELDHTYDSCFDFIILTIGALCWFRSMTEYFTVVCRCLKPGGVIVINEQHPNTNMLASAGEDCFDASHPLDAHYSYFSHEWKNENGMYYITGRSYHSKTFTDYTHSLSEIMTGLTENGMVITGFQEMDYDLSGGFGDLSGKGYPLSMLIEAKKN